MTLSIGSTGADVTALQRALNAHGATLVADGAFGPRTHNAVLAFQAARNLPTTGIVGAREQRLLAAQPVLAEVALPTLEHSIPLIEARYFNRAVIRRPRMIVLHSMEAAESSTTAENCARMFATLPADLPKNGWKSVGYCIDSDSVVQCVADHRVAYHAPGVNEIAIGIEHAGYARQTRAEWLDAFGQRMLSLSVQLAARLCRQWAIEPRLLTAADLPGAAADARSSGITTHAAVSEAFKRSDHTDPGPAFPLDRYIERVAAAVAAAREPVA